MANEKELPGETVAPEGMRLYTIVGIGKESLNDGKWWLEAVADDGTTITLGNLAEGKYEVIVRDDTHGWRHYTGGVGSPAHERYETYLRLYDRFVYERLDELLKANETDSTR